MRLESTTVAIHSFISFTTAMSIFSPPKPRKKRTRTTWKTCSAGRWKPCRRSVCHILPASEREGGMNGPIGCCVWVYFCVSEENWLYVTLAGKNAVDFIFPSSSEIQRSLSGAFILKLYHCTLAKSPHIFTLNFNTILALNGHCIGQGYVSAHRVHTAVESYELRGAMKELLSD